MAALLRDHEFKISYGPQDDRLDDFYIPALERSVQYDRAAGFFSSSALAIAAAGIGRLIQNGGRMRLLVGAKLYEEDVNAIEDGYSLMEQVSGKLLAVLDDPEDLLMRRRLEALAWMVADGMLEIRVVLPTDPSGKPLAGDDALDYYHAKEGIFTDSEGNRIAFSGSVNESFLGWKQNYEQFSVYRSWDASQPYLAQVEHRFENLWRGSEPDWIAVPVTQAVQDKLISFRPDEPPMTDPLERTKPKPKCIEDGQGDGYDASEPTTLQQDRIVVEFLRDAPYLPNAGRLGAATAAVDPWPHQHRVADAIVQRFPERFLIADEVGLGKTIEAGLAIRQLVLSGRAKRCLILTPKSVQRQWQEELYEKFVLDVPRYDGKTFFIRTGQERPVTTENPFDSEPILLATSQLVKRRERQGQLLAAKPWDLVIVDEAHHARRRDFLSGRYRPNRLLELLHELKRRTHGLVLLTATPMQVDPVEVWDLLTLLGVGGRWAADSGNFLRFFREIRKPFEEIDWNFVLNMVRDYFQTGGTEDPVFAETARQRIGVVEWQRVSNLPFSHERAQVLKHLSPSARAVTVEYARRHTPLRRFVFRNTRSLLREYANRGLITATIPYRDPRPVWISMEPAEQELYERIEEYIADFYAKFEAERKGLGFIMTVYRRRLTSSFYAIEQSLDRRLKFLMGMSPDQGFDDDDLEQEDLEQDISEELPEELPATAKEEIQFVQDFLQSLRQLSTDSKFEHLARLLSDLFRQRDTVVIFTQYTDTMDYLREELRQVYGSQVACYSGRGGEEWRDGEWVVTTKEEIKNAFRSGEQVKILLCTEAASEGLNLQTCGVLINYDMPWNPMRVEQRIGRIDRIGQHYPTVWIRNYFYEDTIEAQVHQRLSDRIDWFQTVVGDLQPILSRVARSIETLAMISPTERRARLDQEIAALRAELDQQQVNYMSLDDFADDTLEHPVVQPPVTLANLEQTLTKFDPIAYRLRPHPSIEQAYLLAVGDEQVGVTFNAAVFDAHPDTLHLLSYGDRIFEQLLAEIDHVQPSGDSTGVLRCLSTSSIPIRSWFVPADSQHREIESVEHLESSVESELPAWPDEILDEAKAIFSARVSEVQQRESMLTRQRQEAERLSLEEQGRQLLLKAALIEIALGQKPDLFGESLPWEFSPKAVEGLRRHKFPFAPLLRLVAAHDLDPSPADPYLVSLQGDSPETLRRKFEQLKLQASALVEQLGAARDEQQFTPVAIEVAGQYQLLPARVAPGSE